jgi:hypothetical protein
MAVGKGVLAADPPVEPLTTIDVLGKTADAVANAIIAKLGDAPQKGCVFILQGLSGTGKGTTVAKLQSTLPKAVAWSNGNVFRSLTLLAVTKCEQAGTPFGEAALTPKLLAECMTYLKFGKFKGGAFDIKIEGLGLNLLVSEVANTTLKEPKVGKNIPTVAKMTRECCWIRTRAPSLAPASSSCGRRCTVLRGSRLHRCSLRGGGHQVCGGRGRADARRWLQRAHGGPGADSRLRAHAPSVRADPLGAQHHRHAPRRAAHDGRGAQDAQGGRCADARARACSARIGTRHDDQVRGRVGKCPPLRGCVRTRATWYLTWSAHENLQGPSTGRIGPS